MVQLDRSIIQRACLLRGWTWEDLARSVPLAAGTRTRVANGREISIRTARRVCKVLGLSLRKTFTDGGMKRDEAPEPVGHALRGMAVSGQDEQR